MKKLPFNSYNDFMKKLFKVRVYKISIDAGFTCPNRDNTKGINGCIFCDERGSSSRTQNINCSIKEQILNNIKIRKTRYKAKKFIIYFQSFSNTYAPIKRLKELYDEAISIDKDIIGLNIATRADCIDEEKIKLISSYKKKLPFVCIEYGMQTSHNKTLKIVNRKETFEDFLYALDLTKKHNIHHCAHVILNLPQESIEDQLKTAMIISKLKIEGIKIHLLVAMEGTILADMYKKNLWKPLSFKKYIHLACDFIERLHPECIIHRVSSSGHPKAIIAPIWMKRKNLKIIEALIEEFKKRGTKQGFYFKN
ncbi:MAG: hypothetical protein AMS24_02575 [Chlamydiae bacterium SM23_39]|nr:MAG: hypothetical protein AMS24_02575 [Chlamydiae bacterium SM23_39]